MSFISKQTLKTIVQSATIATGACCLVLLTAVIITRSRSVEDGVGGFETPGIPIVNETSLNGLSASATDSTENYELSYTAYRVRAGDMIGVIAENTGLTSDTIISVNSVRSSRNLQIGTYLRIPSMPGILYTVRNDGEILGKIAEKYKIDLEKCVKVNNITEDAELKAGTTLFLPDAQLDWVTRQEINGDLFHRPIHSRYYLSSYFGWRASPFTGSRSYHSGIDLACPKGTPIYSALDGKVTATGFNNTYGNYVIVTHHSGYKTLYGHMSEIIAVKGQWVTTNTKIGKVGSTGLSTGPHLHFTVFKNGKQVNPMNLLN